MATIRAATLILVALVGCGPRPIAKVDKIPDSACEVEISRNGMSYEGTVDPCVAGTINLAKEFVAWACMNKCAGFVHTPTDDGMMRLIYKECEIKCGLEPSYLSWR